MGAGCLELDAMGVTAWFPFVLDSARGVLGFRPLLDSMALSSYFLGTALFRGVVGLVDVISSSPTSFESPFVDATTVVSFGAAFRPGGRPLGRGVLCSSPTFFVLLLGFRLRAEAGTESTTSIPTSSSSAFRFRPFGVVGFVIA